MKLCLKKLLILAIISCFLAIPSASGTDINTDKNHSTDGIISTASGSDINPSSIHSFEGIQDISDKSMPESDEKLANEKNDNGNANSDKTDSKNKENESDSNNDDNELNDTIQKKDTETSAMNETIVKSKKSTKILIKSTRLHSRDKITIYLKDSNNNPLKFKILNLTINKKTYKIKSNSMGIASLSLFLAPKSYSAYVKFGGDDDYKASSKKLKVKVSKLGTKIKTYSNYVVKKNRLYIYLIGTDWKGISKRKVIIKFKSRTYKKTTNKNGCVSLKISLPVGKYKISAKFKGDKYFSKSSKKFKFYITRSIRFNIGNHKLLKDGYLRIYLKGKSKKDIYKKRMTIKIGNKKFVKRTNGEGIIVFKPKVSVKNHTVIVKYGKYSVNKRLACINAPMKDPLKDNISLVNGAPDTDYMPGTYVMGDGSRTYTLTKSQYMEVLRRDSYCLFLNNKLSRYVFFKTKFHPYTKHIIKREKWNVIEREINRKLVIKNRQNYWPGQVKASLKGKSYKYSEVRDPQDTTYTCGPTSASVCSQVLRNYVCERQLARLAGTDREGTKIPKLEKALKRNNFTCTYFYKDSFNIGLSELKKGGCALVFHTQNHYVAILDINKKGNKVLVSNSYGNYCNIKTGWISTAYMNRKFGHFHDSLVIRLNYTLSNSKKNSVNCFYNSMGRNWYRHGERSNIGKI